MIYLDYAATTPISEQSLQMYCEISKHYYGNPSSLHDIGSSANQILEASRMELAKCFNGDGRGVYFTGGGSDANALAIRSLVKAHDHKGKHLITSSIEHSSVINTFKELESVGYAVSYLPVDEYGKISIDHLANAITPETILVSIAHVNGEIGTIQPIEEIGSILHEKGIIFHSDCVQSFGKILLDVKKAHIDSISISSHKIYGPKGVGACYIAPHVRWLSTIPNTTHEQGFRPGTVNVPGIAALVTAAHEMKTMKEEETVRIEELRKLFISQLKAFNGRVVVEGHPLERLPHIVGLRIKGMEGQYTMLECNRGGIAISTGSACQVGMQKPSKTILAIGKTEQEAMEFIRISMGRFTTDTDIKKTIQTFMKIFHDYFKENEVKK